jgi:SAM-dependent methyltransferase
VSQTPELRAIKADLVRSYDASATVRDARGEPAWRDTYRTAFAVNLRHGHKTRILEIGAGSGHSAAFFASEGFDVVAVDLAPLNIERCLAKGIDALVADFANLPFADGAFHGIWSMSCLMHSPDVELPQVLGEMARVLAPGGAATIGMWGGDGTAGTLDDGVHDPPRFFALRTDEQVRTMFGAVFSIERLETRPGGPEDADNEHYQIVTMSKP